MTTSQIPAIISRMITREPLTVAAGDTVTWSRTLADYPASTGWVLKYALRGPAVVDITGSSDGDTHIITIAPADLTTAGTYAVQGYVENGSERRTVYTGRLKVTPDLTAADATFDPRSHAQKVVEAIEAVIEGRATRDQQEMWIDGERIVRTPFDELLKIRQRYRHEIAAAEARERRSHGRSSGRTIKFRL